MDFSDAARLIEASPDFRLLRRVPAPSSWVLRGASGETRRGVLVDTETTGLDPDIDQVIELALLPFEYERGTGAFLRVDQDAALSAFRQPSFPIPPESSKIRFKREFSSSSSRSRLMSDGISPAYFFFIDPSDPILKWRSFFQLGGRMSRRAHWRASWSVARWTFGIALLITALTVSFGAWLGGLAGMLVGLATGILVGALLQAIPLTALQIQRLHDFGWSAKILVALLLIVLAPLLLFAATAATGFAHLETFGPWLLGCAFVGVAAYIALGWFLSVAEGSKTENQYGPPPND